MVLADGVYRAHGQPFLCHLVRTASIVLAEGQSLALVQAAMTHAAYSLGAGLRLRQRRQWLRERLGADVETLVFAYDQLPWNSPERISEHVNALASYDPIRLGAVVIRLANELEDHLDRSMTYSMEAQVRQRASWQKPCLELARMVSSPTLTAELVEAFDGQLNPPIPDSVVIRREHGYSLRSSARWLEMAGARRVARALLRRLRARSAQAAAGSSRQPHGGGQAQTAQKPDVQPGEARHFP